MHELYDKYYGLEADLEELTETNNYIGGISIKILVFYKKFSLWILFEKGSKDDINARGYFQAQFAWGKKVISFYRHPADDFKGARGTKNILGR